MYDQALSEAERDELEHLLLRLSATDDDPSIRDLSSRLVRQLAREKRPQPA